VVTALGVSGAALGVAADPGEQFARLSNTELLHAGRDVIGGAAAEALEDGVLFMSKLAS
jgi:hypothetical protein